VKSGSRCLSQGWEALRSPASGCFPDAPLARPTGHRAVPSTAMQASWDMATALTEIKGVAGVPGDSAAELISHAADLCTVEAP